MGFVEISDFEEGLSEAIVTTQGENVGLFRGRRPDAGCDGESSQGGGLEEVFAVHVGIIRLGKDTKMQVLGKGWEPPLI